jgi:hypothetical protein
VFSQYKDRSLAYEVIDSLQWRGFADFERDLLSLDA